MVVGCWGGLVGMAAEASWAAMTASEVEEAAAMADGGGDGVTLFGHARQGGGEGGRKGRKGEEGRKGSRGGWVGKAGEAV